jgi:anti-anti-sigma factor
VAKDSGSVTFAVPTDLDGTAIVAIGGDLDIASAPAVRERLLSLLRPGSCRLVIDMSAVRYADASGLAVLVQAARSLLFVLGREPLTYSPIVAATASRLRRLFPAGQRPGHGLATS